MTKNELDNVRLWQTKLVAAPLVTDQTNAVFVAYPTWIVTEFVRRIHADEMEYVVQPLVNEGEINEGVTGMSAYVLTQEELRASFQIK